LRTIGLASGLSPGVSAMPCPWYSQGFCTSPKLEIPSDAVTSPERCLGDETRYTSCPYYVEPSARKKQRNTSIPKHNLRVYAPIHALVYDVHVECPYAEIVKLENGIKVLYCKALDRLMTRFEAELCSKYWRDCPYREIASKTSS